MNESTTLVEALGDHLGCLGSLVNTYLAYLILLVKQIEKINFPVEKFIPFTHWRPLKGPVDIYQLLYQRCLFVWPKRF